MPSESLEKNYATAVEASEVVRGAKGAGSWLVDMLERAVKLNECEWVTLLGVRT